jgi:glycosyltransferase involved in cell wall biosynthesis
MTPVSSILRQATRLLDEKLNILTAPTHEAYETNLCATGFDFYSVPDENFKKWNPNYRPVPSNYKLLKSKMAPLHKDIDVILSQNKFGQFQVLGQMSAQFAIPLVSLEHTLPVPQWGPQQREALRRMRGHLNVFISEFSVREWGFDLDDPSVRIVHHGIDTDLFCPTPEEFKTGEPSPHVLCVVNDWINRDWCCNFSGFQRIANGLPVRILGDTPGLSYPARSVSHLVEEYRTSRIFLNTSTISPVPTALMEAMACGCAIVTTETCMIPEIIQDGVNGLMSNDESVLRGHLERLVKDKDYAEFLGRNARQTILDKFNLEQFKSNWTKVLREGAEFNPCP